MKSPAPTHLHPFRKAIHGRRSHQLQRNLPDPLAEKDHLDPTDLQDLLGVETRFCRSLDEAGSW